MKQTVLITGVGGYVGTIIAYNLLQNNFHVIGIDNFSTGFREPLTLLQKKFSKKQFRFYDADLTKDISSIFLKEPSINIVIHLAGYCSVNESINNPEKYFTNNVTASQNLFATMVKFNIRDIIFSSTCAVYGEADKRVTEKNERKPTNPYGESKKMVEDMLQWYGKSHNFRYVILRYFNVCGASQDGVFGDSKKPSPHLVQNCVRDALGIDSLSITCPRVRTPDGTTIRDYIDVVDLAQAHISAIEYLNNGGKNEAINISGGKGNSVMQIIKIVEEYTGKKIVFTKGAIRKGEYSSMTASHAKATRLLRWKPKRPLAKSIESLISWYTKHPKGWEY